MTEAESSSVAQNCQALRSLRETMDFLANPPAWRTLCEPLTPHSPLLIRNIDLIGESTAGISIDRPEDFCHYNPDKEKVIRRDEKTLPKTLVCHDMANGYHDDCLIDGSSEFDNYMFYNWAAVDVFCYFSHHLVTVPPLGWINVAHKHGVKVIGTLITEHAEGARLWEGILDSEDATQTLVSALVTIAKTLKFEGWLLNVENKVSQPAKLLQFVRSLHRTLHAEVPGAVLIWYDSVTTLGDLLWQNRLNHLNRAFFDACDGIFTNYSWTEEDVRESAREAGRRRSDVYVGIDVWGRNFYGGGMLNTQEAVRVVHRHACSLAIFAPAWTHEACPRDRADPRANYCRYRLRERALWGSLWPFLHTRPPCQLPFRSSFCTGHGLQRRMYGEVVSNTPWYNLRHMQYQPNSIHGSHGLRLTAAAHQQTQRAPQSALKDEVLNHLDSNAIDEGPSESERSELGARTQLVKRNLKDPSTVFQTSWTRCKTACKNLFSKSGVKQKHSSEPPSSMEDEGLGSQRSRAGSLAPDEGAPAAGTPRRAPSDPVRLDHVEGERACIEEYAEDSFVGGTCLLLTPCDGSQRPRTIRLLHTDFFVADSLVVCLATKTLRYYPHQYLTLLLHMHRHCDQGPESPLVLAAHEAAPPDTVRPLTPGTQPFRAMQVQLLLSHPDFYVPTENRFGWNVFYFEVHLPKTRITTIGARTALPEGGILLGHLGLCALGSCDPGFDLGTSLRDCGVTNDIETPFRDADFKISASEEGKPASLQNASLNVDIGTSVPGTCLAKTISTAQLSTSAPGVDLARPAPGSKILTSVTGRDLDPSTAGAELTKSIPDISKTTTDSAELVTSDPVDNSATSVPDTDLATSVTICGISTFAPGSENAASAPECNPICFCPITSAPSTKPATPIPECNIAASISTCPSSLVSSVPESDPSSSIPSTDHDTDLVASASVDGPQASMPVADLANTGPIVKLSKSVPGGDPVSAVHCNHVATSVPTVDRTATMSPALGTCPVPGGDLATTVPGADLTTADAGINLASTLLVRTLPAADISHETSTPYAADSISGGDLPTSVPSYLEATSCPQIPGPSPPTPPE